MGKKLLALALVGTAAYLFKTQKGNELRKQMGKTAGQWKDKLTDMYRQQTNGTQPLEDMA